MDLDSTGMFPSFSSFITISSYGQLAQGNNTDDQLFPIKIDLPFTVKDIHCGWHYSIFLTTDNKWYGCGSNSSAELAATNQPKSNILTPTEMIFPNIESNKEVQWRLFSCSFSSNTYLLALYTISKRCQWMKQKLRQCITETNNLADIYIQYNNQ